MDEEYPDNGPTDPWETSGPGHNPLNDPTGTLATIRWLPIDQYEMDGKDVLLRWRHGYVMRGSGKIGQKSRDGMPLDGRELPRCEGRAPLMFARLPLKDEISRG